ELVLNGTLIIGLLYMSVLASGLGWLMWLGVIQRVSTTVVSMSSLGVPVLAILLAWLLLGEQPSYLDLMGVALVVMGLVVVNWPSRRRAKSVCCRCCEGQGSSLMLAPLSIVWLCFFMVYMPL